MKTGWSKAILFFILFLLVVSIFPLNINTGAFIVSPGVTYNCDNEYYSVTTPVDFDNITTDVHWISFNGIGFNVSSALTFYMNISAICPYPKSSLGYIINWTGQKPGAAVAYYWINGLKLSHNYILYKNASSELKMTAVNGSFMINQTESTRDYKIRDGVNSPPVFVGESPSNNSVGVSLLLASWTITINDPDGDHFNWNIVSIPDIGSAAAFGDGNGSKGIFVAGLGYSTTYKVYVNATDGFGWIRAWYQFTTEAAPGGGWVNRAPTFSNPVPTNGSIGVLRYCKVNITVGDADGNMTKVCFWYSLSNSPYSWVKAQQNNSIPANSTVRDMNASYVTGYSTEYWLKITADDAHINVSVVYHFTTEAVSSGTPGGGAGGNVGTYMVYIKVQDNITKKPISEAKVILESLKKTTDTNGVAMFSFFAGSPDTYVVHVSASGYVSMNRSVFLTAGKTVIIDMSPASVGHVFPAPVLIFLIVVAGIIVIFIVFRRK